MKRFVALFALAVLLVPSSAMAAPPMQFPTRIVTLSGEWIREAEAFAGNDTEKEWYPEAKVFLDHAKEMQAAGRVRSVMFDLETHYEMILAYRLLDEASSIGSEAERKSLAIRRANAWQDEAEDAWRAFRERVDSIEDDVRSLHAMEITLFAVDNSLGAYFLAQTHDALVREINKYPKLDRDVALQLVRIEKTPVLNLEWSHDLLDVASEFEGLPPRLDLANWTVQVNGTLQDPGWSRVPAHLEELEFLARDARNNTEGILALSINLAEQRASRAHTIGLIFGDAGSRGIDIHTDAARGMRRQLNETTLDVARDYGLLGLFTMDAADRALFTERFIEEGNVEFGTIVAAWSSLDHQKFATGTLAAASTVTPPPPEDPKAQTPGAGLVLVALALVGAALVAKRRS